MTFKLTPEFSALAHNNLTVDSFLENSINTQAKRMLQIVQTAIQDNPDVIQSLPEQSRDLLQKNLEILKTITSAQKEPEKTFFSREIMIIQNIIASMKEPESPISYSLDAESPEVTMISEEEDIARRKLILLGLLYTESALLGAVTNELRAVTVDVYPFNDQNVLFLRFYHDGEISEEIRDLWECCITEASTALGPDALLDRTIEQLDYPMPLPTDTCYAFLRQEDPL